VKRAARGSLKIQDAKTAKKSPSGHHRTTLSGCICATKVWTIGKKLVKQQYLPHMSSQHGELRPTNGWDRFGCLGHPNRFQRVLRPGLVTAATSLTGGQQNFAQSLAVSWAGTLYVHFRGLLPHNEILPGAKFTLCPSLALSYIGSVTAEQNRTAWHSCSGRQPNFVALTRGCHLYSAGRPSRRALAHILVVFSFFIILFCLVPCGRLSWLVVSFCAHVNILHRIVS